MQLITAAILAMVAGVPALPPSPNQDLAQVLADNSMALVSQSPCGTFMQKAVCCRKSLLPLIEMGCHRAKADIHTGLELAAECEAKGKQPRCCILGLLGFYGPCKPPYAVASEFEYYYNGTEYDVQVAITDKDTDAA